MLDLKSIQKILCERNLVCDRKINELITDPNLREELNKLKIELDNYRNYLS